MKLLTDKDYHLLGEAQFGVPGLVATEIIGPFVELQSSGPLIMVHDGVFQPRHGIGHHPHRFNERLFYILEGAVDHDDALNDIQGHMGAGDLGRLTEGMRGMLHKEWNNTDGVARAFILVYETEPTPREASFALLEDEEAARYDESDGVATKEIVGSKVGFPINGDIRLFADSTFEPGATLRAELDTDEGGLIFSLDGHFTLFNGAGVNLARGDAVVFEPSKEPRTFTLHTSGGGRVLRVVHGPSRR
ncbi:MAG: pirin family protein [Actinomycetota bacterium]